ncbi:hypothetical protein NSZ01_01770 [Nocardioides szechwanensis]|nr:hypothetical protein NSZ01_01770 [Nocardioides szechwanensis]
MQPGADGGAQLADLGGPQRAIHEPRDDPLLPQTHQSTARRRPPADSRVLGRGGRSPGATRNPGVPMIKIILIILVVLVILYVARMVLSKR